jgi:hypothetical protein
VNGSALAGWYDGTVTVPEFVLEHAVPEFALEHAQPELSVEPVFEPVAKQEFVFEHVRPEHVEASGSGSAAVPLGRSAWSKPFAANAFFSAALAHEAGEPVGCSVCSKPLCVDANDSAEYVDSMLLLNAVCMPPVAKAALLRPDGSVKPELVPWPAFVLKHASGCDSAVRDGGGFAVCIGTNCVVCKVATATDAVSNDSGCESAACDCSAPVANVTAVLKNAWSELATAWTMATQQARSSSSTGRGSVKASGDVFLPSAAGWCSHGLKQWSCEH